MAVEQGWSSLPRGVLSVPGGAHSRVTEAETGRSSEGSCAKNGNTMENVTVPRVMRLCPGLKHARDSQVTAASGVCGFRPSGGSCPRKCQQ